MLPQTSRWQVAPAELEALILQHPGVRDCAVVGVLSDDGTTGVPRAYVVRKEGGGSGWLTSWKKKKSNLGDEVYKLVADRLASYKRLEWGIVFVDAIPRRASGKTQRFKLVEQDEEVGGEDDPKTVGRPSPVVWALNCYALAKSTLKSSLSI